VELIEGVVESVNSASLCTFDKPNKLNS